MKIKYLIIALILLSKNDVYSQQTITSDYISSRIADRMKDSLMLTMNQRNQIFSINVMLQNEKSSIRQLINSSDTIRIKIQLIENSRDSLYNTILSSQQYLLYREKKRNLIKNN
jgi:hypothetical protein